MPIVEGFPALKVGNWSNCAHCGEISQCRDDAWPVVWLTAMDRKTNRNLIFQFGPQVLSCSQCNSMLGSKAFDSFDERCRFVSNKLFTKAQRKSASWDQDEIDQLTDSLKLLVLQKQREKRTLQERSEWFQSDGYYSNLEQLIYENLLNPDSNSFHNGYYEYFRTTLDIIKGRVNIGKNVQRKTQTYIRVG